MGAGAGRGSVSERGVATLPSEIGESTQLEAARVAASVISLEINTKVGSSSIGRPTQGQLVRKACHDSQLVSSLQAEIDTPEKVPKA